MTDRAPFFVVNLLIIGTLLAGCMSGEKEGQDCVVECEEPGEPVFAALGSISFEDCHGFDTLEEVPAEWVRPHVPDAFEIGGLAPGTASIGLHGFSCARVIINATVYEDVAHIQATVSARALDPEWQEGYATAVYVLDFFVSDAEFADALVAYGFNARFGDVQSTTVGLPEGAMHRFVAADDRGSIAVHYTATSEGPGRNSGDVHLWSGDGPFLRVNEHRSWHRDTAGVTGLSVISAGETTFNKVHQGAPWASQAGNYKPHYQASWNLTTPPFE